MDEGILTGNATESEVASSAAMSVRMHRLPKAARNLQLGWNFSGFSVSICIEEASISGSDSGILCSGGRIDDILRSFLVTGELNWRS